MLDWFTDGIKIGVFFAGLAVGIGVPAIVGCWIWDKITDRWW